MFHLEFKIAVFHATCSGLSLACMQTAFVSLILYLKGKLVRLFTNL